MQSISRAQACVAGLAALALATSIAGATGIASASTEPVAANLAAPGSLSPDDCLDSSTSPAHDTDTGCRASLPHATLKTIRLDWAPVSGATGYRVQVGTDSTWSDAPTLTQDVSSSELTLPVWLPHATYVWRVAALRGATLGHWSSESTQLQSEAQFTRGWRDAPTTNAVVTPFEGRPTYSWSPVPSASGYQVQVSTDPFFNSGSPTASGDTTPSPQTQTQAKTILDTCFTPRTRVTPALGRVGAEGSVGDCTFTVPAPGTALYWRVRALDRFVGSAQPVDTTPASTGGISYQAPATGPTQSDVTSDCPGVTASASPSATATATASASPSASASAGGTSSACDPANASEAGNWSAASSFTYTAVDHSGESYAPGNVTTSSLASDPDGLCSVSNPSGPDAEKATCKDFPTISWSHVTGALRYRLYIALDDQFSNIQAIVESSGPQWTPTASWRDSSPNTSYYYVVQACNDTSCGPVTSTPRSFRKVSDRPTLGARPGVTGDARLTWQSYASTLSAATGRPATQDAYAYHLQVASADHPSYDALVDEATVDETSYVAPDKIYPDGSFVWRVQAVDSAGHKLPWSLSQAFTRDATPPSAISVSPSSKVGITAALRVTFSETVTGVSVSSLNLGSGVPVSVSVLDGQHATIVPTRPFVPGATYRVTLGPAIKDVSGNSAVAVGPTVTVNPLVDDNSRAMTYAGSWRVAASSNAVGGGYHTSAPTPTAQSNATLVFRGTAVAVTACLGPANGFVDLYVDGARKARVSTYRSFSGCGVRIAALGGLARVQHTFRLVGIGSHVASSKGSAVGLDALTVTP